MLVPAASPRWKMTSNNDIDTVGGSGQSISVKRDEPNGDNNNVDPNFTL